jgi:hypothetical protein
MNDVRCALKSKINIKKNFSKVTLCSGDTAINLMYLFAYILTVQSVYIFHRSADIIELYNSRSSFCNVTNCSCNPTTLPTNNLRVPYFQGIVINIRSLKVRNLVSRQYGTGEKLFLLTLKYYHHHCSRHLNYLPQALEKRTQAEILIINGIDGNSTLQNYTDSFNKF